MSPLIVFTVREVVSFTGIVNIFQLVPYLKPLPFLTVEQRLKPTTLNDMEHLANKLDKIHTVDNFLFFFWITTMNDQTFRDDAEYSQNLRWAQSQDDCDTQCGDCGGMFDDTGDGCPECGRENNNSQPLRS